MNSYGFVETQNVMEHDGFTNKLTQGFRNDFDNCKTRLQLNLFQKNVQWIAIICVDKDFPNLLVPF